MKSNNLKYTVTGMLVLPLTLLVAGLVAASSVSTPNTFVSGTTISAADMNANFAAMEAAINDNDSRIASLESVVPSFRAEVLASNPFSGTGTIVFDTERHDDGGVFNNTTGVFTAPQSGTYHFTLQTMYDSGSATLEMWRNTNVERLAMFFFNETREIGTMAVTVKLTAGDTVSINRPGTTSLFGTDGSNQYTIFCGHLLR